VVRADRRHEQPGLRRAGHETGATVEVLGRRLFFPHAAGGLLRASFQSLCGEPLGPQDYLAVAERFHTVFLEGLPRLEPSRRNEAKRFVTLVDALYEAGAKLVVLAEAEPETLYPTGDGAFEFERTVSRLQQMRSADWIDRNGSRATAPDPIVL
jgi:cell division protein ZapE